MKRIFFLLIVLTLCISLTSAFEFDNVKSYNKEEKVMTIQNSLLGIPTSKVADIKLVSDNIVYVIPGKDRLVAQFDINNYEDKYNNAFKKMQFYDIRNKNREFERNFTYKYLLSETRTVDKTSYECNYLYSINGSKYIDTCQDVKVGTESKLVNEWKELDINKPLPTGKLTIGIFTDVYQDEQVEWIPTLFNERINEWAVWNSSLSINLQHYYNLDETGSNRNDSVSGRNASTSGTNLYTDYGKSLKAAASTGSGWINFSNITDSKRNLSISFWANFSSTFPINWQIFGDGNFYYYGQLELSTGDCDQVSANTFRLYINGTCINSNARNIRNGLWQHYLITINGDTKNVTFYQNGTITNSSLTAQTFDRLKGNFTLFYSDSNNVTSGAYIDELGIWSRILQPTEADQLWNGGIGIFYTTSAYNPFNIDITLLSPSNGISTVNASLNFTGNFSVTNANFTNATLYIWYTNGSIFKVNNTNINGTRNSSSLFIHGLSYGNFLWNYYVCAVNSTNFNCSTANTNFSFNNFAFNILNSTYTNNAMETERQTFQISVSTVTGTGISLGKLIYNGTEYAVSDVTQNGNNYTFTKVIDLPLNPDKYNNYTNSFKWRFTLTGTTSLTQDTGDYSQNTSYIILQICNSTFPTTSLNFTFYDEIASNNINSAGGNLTSLYSSFLYWVGGGGYKKNYSFQNVSSVENNYRYCIYPYNSSINFKSDMDMSFNAVNYLENEYALRNASLTSTQNNILLFLLPTTSGTKFEITFKKGINFLTNSVVTIQKYFVGEGIYKTVGIKVTDSNGELPMYLDLDDSYRFTVVKNGELMGSKDLSATCLTSPCTLSVFFGETLNGYNDGYNQIIANGTASNMYFNKTSKILTYSFIDTTGLANYFRLVVSKSSFNVTGQTICDTKSYTSAGSLSCDLTNYTGDFSATGYISRSPEKIDIYQSFVIDGNELSNLGLMGLFLSMCLLIMIVFAGAAISKGNPSTILYFLGIGILGLKLIGIFPFSWTVIVSIELLIGLIIMKVKV